MAGIRGEERIALDASRHVQRLSKLLEDCGVDIGKLAPKSVELLRAVVEGHSSFLALAEPYREKQLEVVGLLADFDDYVKQGRGHLDWTLRYVSVDLDYTMLVIYDERTQDDQHAIERYISRLEREGEGVSKEIKNFFERFKAST